MTYTVKYRKPGSFLWTTLKRVKFDGIEPDLFRWFHLDDDQMVYIPLHMEVKLSKERWTAIERKMSKEAGQPIMRTE